MATPDALLAGLQLQTDLQVVNVDPNYTVYKNAAWAPARAVLPPSAVPVAAARRRRGRALQQIDLRGRRPCSTGGTPTRAHGEVPAGAPCTWRPPARAAGGCGSGSTSIRPQPAFGGP